VKRKWPWALGALILIATGFAAAMYVRMRSELVEPAPAASREP
jgi:hypothetical protein